MKKAIRKSHLLLFPLLEVLSFSGSIWALHYSWLLAGLGIVISSLFLNFSLHITFHYMVHFKAKNDLLNFVLEVMASILMGISFKNYQMGHLSHHKYDNRFGDFTSTWKGSKEKPKPQNIWTYSLLWFLQAQNRKANKNQAIKDGYLTPSMERYMKLEFLYIAIFIGILFYISSTIAVCYLLTIYLGWVFVSIHNYGQHLPVFYGQWKGNSFKHSVYNCVFVNNGLHLEHHEKPAIPYWDLKVDQNVDNQVKHPHLLAGFYSSNIKNRQL